jgi:hypothetical protein
MWWRLFEGENTKSSPPMNADKNGIYAEGKEVRYQDRGAEAGAGTRRDGALTQGDCAQDATEEAEAQETDSTG